MPYDIFSALDVEILVHDLLDGLVVVGDVGVTVDGVLDDRGGTGCSSLSLPPRS